MMRKAMLLGVTHLVAGLIGFAGGIYVLPILTAPPPPLSGDIRAHSASAEYKGKFRRDLKDSDLLHWGEGQVSVSTTAISLTGRLAPGPDYKLYLSPEFVETEADFMRLKNSMVRIGDVKTFENFIVPLPPGIDPRAYNTVIVWCEAFSQFITAAKYR